MPPGGDGFYYFSTYLLVTGNAWARFSIEVNGEVLCTAQTNNVGINNGQAACSAATYATEGW